MTEVPKITDWIQASCALLGLVGLAVYAVDTRKLQEATSAQNVASRRPFFVLKAVAGDFNFVRYFVENVGAGIALSVQLEYMTNARHSERSPSGRAVPIGSSIELADFHSSSLMEEIWKPRIGLRVIYSDTSGKQYWTEFTAIRPSSGSATGIVETGEYNRRIIPLIDRIERWNRALEGGCPDD